MKTPVNPVWIVGSQSHFSVLFATGREAIEETYSDRLLERVRRGFRVVDVEESGFIQMTSLLEVLTVLDLEEKVGVEGVQRLAQFLEEDGSGIIIWDGFWKTISRLMTGATLNAVLASGPAAPLPAVPRGTG